MDAIEWIIMLAAVAMLGAAAVLEMYKTLGRRRQEMETFELVGLNLMSWGLLTLAGMLLGIVLMLNMLA
ncbi:MAG: hypothetical protein H6642_13260 [Caldilineaceae bacterium]|nr:hypothetical protein [Caldilineaceae bacterium]MCB9139309.1 hypothetical protein [Caldilineaceae bacterium]